MLSTKKICPGLYAVTVHGVRYLITDGGGDVPGYAGWQWRVDNEGADDIYATKREAVEALTEWVNGPHAKRVADGAKVAT